MISNKDKLKEAMLMGFTIGVGVGVITCTILMWLIEIFLV